MVAGFFVSHPWLIGRVAVKGGRPKARIGRGDYFCHDYFDVYRTGAVLGNNRFPVRRGGLRR